MDGESSVSSILNGGHECRILSGFFCDWGAGDECKRIFCGSTINRRGYMMIVFVFFNGYLV